MGDFWFYRLRPVTIHQIEVTGRYGRPTRAWAINAAQTSCSRDVPFDCVEIAYIQWPSLQPKVQMSLMLWSPAVISANADKRKHEAIVRFIGQWPSTAKHTLRHWYSEADIMRYILIVSPAYYRNRIG